MSQTVCEVGAALPRFSLQDELGNAVNSDDLRGRWVVLYFYPKDNTPGCTTQACDIRDHWEEFSNMENLAIYGVSPDSAASHQRFRDKHALPFSLLVDTDHALAEQLGIWAEKTKFGKTYMGIVRSTVIVNPDGIVHAIKRNVRAADHVAWLRSELPS